MWNDDRYGRPRYFDFRPGEEPGSFIAQRRIRDIPHSAASRNKPALRIRQGKMVAYSDGEVAKEIYRSRCGDFNAEGGDVGCSVRLAKKAQRVKAKEQESKRIE